MYYKWNNYLDYGFCLLLILYVLVFFSLTFFAIPQADDWCFAATTKEHGFLGSIASWYLGWTGIYTTTALMGMPIIGTNLPLAVPIYSAACFLFVWLSIYYLAGTLVEDATKRVTVSLVILSIYLANMPDAAQGFYWISAATSYLLALALFVSAIALLVNIEIGHSRSNIRIGALVLICLLLPGSHGAIGAAVGVGFLLFECIIYIYNRQFSLSIFLASLIIVIGTAIVVVSPGNEARLSGHTNELTLLDMSLSTAKYVIQHVIGWLSVLSVWSGVLLILYMLGSRKTFLSSTSLRFKVLAIIFAGGCVLVILVGLPIWAIGSVPSRLMNFAYFIFLLVFISSLFYCYSWLTQKWGLCFSGKSTLFWFGLRVVLIAALISSDNFQAALHDLMIGRHVLAEETERLEVFEVSKTQGMGNVEIAPIKITPQLLIFPKGDFSNDPAWFANKCAATYYDVKQVISQ